VAPGLYTLTITLSGFATYIEKDLQVKAPMNCQACHR